jgi:hypothetical protein
MKCTTRWLLFFVVKALCLASTPLFGQETTVPLKQQDMIQLDPVVKPRHVTRPLRNMDAQTVSTQASTGTTIPMWSAVATLGSNRYNIRLVGTSVFTAGTTQTTTVQAPIIALVLNMPDGETFSPIVNDGCASASAYTLTGNSPIFKNVNYTWGGNYMGNTQYVDAYQRANFWAYTRPGGTVPNYHVLLGTTNNYYTNVAVPAGQWDTASAPCGRIAGVGIGWLQNYIETTLFSQLNAVGIGSTYFPLILLHNTQMCDNLGCGILGYHGSFVDRIGHLQTYAVADFETSSAIPGFTDIAPLSHEVAEWVDDPTGNNPTPPWGNIGQVAGCQNNLENGDALSGTNRILTLFGYNYHVQELVFVGWFYHLNPSLGINNWYSNFGTFRGFARPCPPGGTN